MDQTQEDVFGTNVIVVQHACLFLGKHNYSTGTVRKSLKHFATLLAAPYLDATSPQAHMGVFAEKQDKESQVPVTFPRKRGLRTAIRHVTACDLCRKNTSRSSTPDRCDCQL
jgi:hypothetical protein